MRAALGPWRTLPLLVMLGAAGCGLRVPPLPDGHPRFVALGDGTVRDGVTGLAWSQNGNLPNFDHPFAGLTWAEALAFVSDMNAGRRPNFGHTDWRLPAATELSALRNAFWLRHSGFWCFSHDLSSGCRGRVEPEPFVDLAEGEYWSGTNAVTAGEHIRPGSYAPVAEDQNAADSAPAAWVIDSWGKAIALPKTSRRRVLPVRGIAGQDLAAPTQ